MLNVGAFQLIQAYLETEKELDLAKNWDQDAQLIAFSWHQRIDVV